jgi:hypothetical protein
VGVSVVNGIKCDLCGKFHELINTQDYLQIIQGSKTGHFCISCIAGSIVKSLKQKSMGVNNIPKSITPCTPIKSVTPLTTPRSPNPPYIVTDVPYKEEPFKVTFGPSCIQEYSPYIGINLVESFNKE